jgi:hypothetical protein
MIIKGMNWSLTLCVNEMMTYWSYSSGPMLPFDSLLLPMSNEEKLLIANATSRILLPSESERNRVMKFFDKELDYSICNITTHDRNCVSQKLTIGFISYDFNDHPTAHLVEGIFHRIRKFRTFCNATYDTGMTINKQARLL